MNLLELQDKINRGDYRSDRFPAVPFVTADDLLGRRQTVGHDACGAVLATGAGLDRAIRACNLPDGHVSRGVQHDWAGSVTKW